MNKLLAALLLIVLTAPAFAATAPETDEQKTLYAIGLIVSRSLSVFNLTPAELVIVQQGINDAVSGQKLAVDLQVQNDKVQELARVRRKAQGEKLAAVNKDFYDKAAAEKGAVKTASGLVYLSLSEGKGDSPVPTDTVKVNYRGSLPDGREFDSSFKRGKPTDLRMDGVIKCWTEGLQKMKAGGKAKLTCPSSLAYGEVGAGDVILPGATLVFEIDLLEIKR
jgi:FKBP-type peptidyl-prolyl cis-trans isomerase FkpA